MYMTVIKTIAHPGSCWLQEARCAWINKIGGTGLQRPPTPSHSRRTLPSTAAQAQKLFNMAYLTLGKQDLRLPT